MPDTRHPTPSFNFRQARAVFSATLRQGMRPNIGADGKRGSSPIRGLVFSMTLAGFLASGAAGRSADLRTYLAFIFASACGLAMFIVMPETVEARQKTLDILFSRPVGMRSVTFGSLAALAVIILMVVGSYVAYPMFVAVRDFGTPLWKLPLAFGVLAVMCITLATLWASLLGLAARWLSPAQLRRFSQLLLLVVLLGPIAFSVVSLTGGRETPLSLDALAFARWLPPVWCVDAVFGSDRLAMYERLACVGLLLGTFALRWQVDASDRIPKVTERMMAFQGETARTPYSVRFLRLLHGLPGIGRWLMAPPVYGVAALILTVITREETTRLRLLIFYLMLFAAFGAAWLMPANPTLPFIVGILGFTHVMDASTVIRQCSQAEATWLLRLTPLSGATIVRGMRWALLARFIPLPALLFAMLSVRSGSVGLAFFLFAAYVCEACLAIAAGAVIKPSLPLSTDVQTASSPLGSVLNYFVTMGAAIAHVIVTTVLTLLYGVSRWPVAAGVCFLAGAVVVVEAWAAARLTRTAFHERSRDVFWRRRAVWMPIAACVLLLALSIGYVLCVPPFGASVPPVSAGVSVPDDRNAWGDYRKAVELFNGLKSPDGRFDAKKCDDIRAKIGKGDVTEAEREWFVSFIRMKIEIERGAGKPFCRIPANGPMRPPLPELMELRGMLWRDALMGETARAFDGYLLATRFTRHLEDLEIQYGQFSSYAAQSLFSVWLRSGDWATCDADTGGRMARELDRLVAGMPTPFSVIQARVALHQQGVEGGGPFQGFRRRSWAMERFPGLRARVVAQGRANAAVALDRLRPCCDRWNFAGCGASDGTVVNRGTYVLWLLLPEAGYATMYETVGFDAGAVAGRLYRERCDLGALAGWSAIAAYKARHGAFPSDLESACREVGIAVPKDVVTNGPVRYRLDGGGPVLWFVGFDGDDDGAARALSADDFPRTISDGKGMALPDGDFVYRFGAPPPHLKSGERKSASPPVDSDPDDDE